MELEKGNSLEYLLWLGKELDQGLAKGKRDALVSLVAGHLKVRNKSGKLVSLKANEVQRKYVEKCSGRNIVLKARQLGMTTWVAASYFLKTITHPGTLTVQVAHDQDSAEGIFRIVHRFLENLPEGLRSSALATSRANVRQLVFPRIDCEYRVETAADPNAGRGLTIQNLHCSEVARWPRNGVEVLAALKAAVAPDGEVVLESTPNGAGGVFYEEWQRAEDTGYTRHFFPWWMEGRYARKGAIRLSLTEEEEELVRQYGLTREQIAFRREIRANFRGLAKQEYAEDAASCFLESGECVFELEAIARRIAELPNPISRRENGRIVVWLPPKMGCEYILGVDAAGGGTDGDFACAEVIERRTGLQCAELHGHFSPQELAMRAARLGREYNDALVAVERNNHGHAVLAHLTTSCEYPNLYKHGGQLGWLTSAATRPPMIENFGAILAARPELFSSERLLTECRTFVRNAGGTPAAVSGAHDDCVMAMAIALAVRAST
jgi:hypothetical protein